MPMHYKDTFYTVSSIYALFIKMNVLWVSTNTLCTSCWPVRGFIQVSFTWQDGWYTQFKGVFFWLKWDKRSIIYFLRLPSWYEQQQQLQRHNYSNQSEFYFNVGFIYCTYMYERLSKSSLTVSIKLNQWKFEHFLNIIFIGYITN